jgi:hypothetical protein
MQRTFLILGVLFLGLAGIALVAATVSPFTEWIAERSTTQTATEYARESTVEDVRQAGWFVGILFVVLAGVFLWVARIVATSAEPSSDAAAQLKELLGDVDNTSVVNYSFDVTDDPEATRVVQDALGRAGVRFSSAGGPAGAGSISEQLAQLSELHRSGVLSDAEFASAKKRLLGS